MVQIKKKLWLSETFLLFSVVFKKSFGRIWMVFKRCKNVKVLFFDIRWSFEFIWYHLSSFIFTNWYPVRHLKWMWMLDSRGYPEGYGVEIHKPPAKKNRQTNKNGNGAHPSLASKCVEILKYDASYHSMCKQILSFFVNHKTTAQSPHIGGNTSRNKSFECFNILKQKCIQQPTSSRNMRSNECILWQWCIINIASPNHMTHQGVMSHLEMTQCKDALAPFRQTAW